MSKHTPTPWLVKVERDEEGQLIEVAVIARGERTGRLVDMCRLFNMGNPESAVANAHLVATAPEMLGILKTLNTSIRDVVRSGQAFPEMMTVLAVVQAVIDKAEGRHK